MSPTMFQTIFPMRSTSNKIFVNSGIVQSTQSMRRICSARNIPAIHNGCIVGTKPFTRSLQKKKISLHCIQKRHMSNKFGELDNLVRGMCIVFAAGIAITVGGILILLLISIFCFIYYFNNKKVYLW